MWLQAATPYIELRSQRSHGFRPGFQAAKVHRLVRELAAKHDEWGIPFSIINLDISKAYDTLEWQAIQDEFVARGMPPAMRRASWDLHAGRQLQFRTGDSTVSFCLVPNRGIPQGSPESPAVYAAGLLTKVEKQRIVNKRPAGLSLSSESYAKEVEDYKKGKQDFKEGDLFALNFADDTYVLGRRAEDASYVLAVIKQKYAGAEQLLHAGKSQCLQSQNRGQNIHVWSDHELQDYVLSGTVPLYSDEHAKTKVPEVDNTLVLGSIVRLKSPTDAPLQGRLKAAWKTYVRVRPQLKQRSVTVRARVVLLEATILPTMLWGTESLDLTSLQRRHITGTQRRMLGYNLQVPKRPSENVESYMKRRERLVSKTLRTHCRAAWGDIQRYRFFSFLGHVARRPSASHLCALVHRWRGSEWWQEYMKHLPDKQKNQPGRRAPYKGRPMPTERPLIDAWATLQKTKMFPRIQKQNPRRAGHAANVAGLCTKS